jgi:transcription antitermination protein NusB
MISRRNIRVKVMQVMYANEAGETPLDKTEAVKILQKEFDRSSELFIYLIYFITEVARYAETDLRLRSSKNIVTESDLNTNIKISGNELLWKILENESFKKAVAASKPSLIIDNNILKKIYNDLVKSEVYQKYILLENRDKKPEKEVLEYILTALMLPNDHFISHAEEHFNNWDDDCEMMSQLVLNFLQKPQAYDLKDIVGKEKWEFAKSLLETTIDKREYLSSLIKPKLQNWDMERIAMLDMILMQMGVCELLYFETIPTKVTINEYIDIAKAYSTQQSGQFVNGILDGIHKELLAENKIHKIDFNKKASKD